MGCGSSNNNCVATTDLRRPIVTAESSTIKREVQQVSKNVLLEPTMSSGTELAYTL